jgi:hypothetical protein
MYKANKLKKQEECFEHKMNHIDKNFNKNFNYSDLDSDL